MAKAKTDIWTAKHVASLAPDAVSIPAAQKVLKKGGFGTVEATADGRGWWVVCRGLTGTYQVTVRRDGDEFDCTCNCLSYKNPCKHALALLLYLVDHPEMRVEAEAPKVAASDFEGLLRGAFREPEEDTPRLVFADFLEENDQPDRAALIRYQCEHARLKPQSKRARELKALIAPLLAKLKKQIEPLPEGMRYEFVRGFIRLDFHLGDFSDVGSLPARVANLFRDGWVESLLADIDYSGVQAFAPQVGELDVSRYAVIDQLLVGLVAGTTAARESGRLARLTVHDRNRETFASLLRIQQGETIDAAGAVEAFRFYAGLNTQTFGLLLRFGRLSGVRELTLDGDLGEAEVAALVTADLSDLRLLRLQHWRFTRAAMETLANSPGLKKLSTLLLLSCNVHAASVSALVKSPLFTTVKTLDLSGNAIGKAGVEALVKAPVPPKLKELTLSGWRLTAPDRRRLKAKFGAKLTV